MRIFQNLNEAASEIRRDLTKSPLVESPTIQNLETPNLKVREALHYSYTILEVPSTAQQVAKVAIENQFIHEEEAEAYRRWAVEEIQSRTRWRPAIVTEGLNPHLANVLEGSSPSYTYTDRLNGMVDSIVATLKINPASRRAYWPMFNHEDALRSSRLTRVPCTLGYWACIRRVNSKNLLHFSYLERSCDFNRFWIWDVWFASRLQWEIYSQLCTPGYKVDIGHLSHTVLSFHYTVEEGEEVY